MIHWHSAGALGKRMDQYADPADRAPVPGDLKPGTRWRCRCAGVMASCSAFGGGVAGKERDTGLNPGFVGTESSLVFLRRQRWRAPSRLGLLTRARCIVQPVLQQRGASRVVRASRSILRSHPFSAVFATRPCLIGLYRSRPFGRHRPFRPPGAARLIRTYQWRPGHSEWLADRRGSGRS